MKITIENLRDVKPSEFILSFKDHVEFMVLRSRQTGKLVNMIAFTDGDGCLACFGGHAAMSLGELDSEGLADLWDSPIGDFSEKSFTPGRAADQRLLLLKQIALVGDCIRNGNFLGVSYSLADIYPELSGQLAHIGHTYHKVSPMVAISGRINPADKSDELIRNIEWAASIYRTFDL